MTHSLKCSYYWSPKIFTLLRLSSSWATDLITRFSFPGDTDSGLKTIIFSSVLNCPFIQSSTVDFTVVCTARSCFSLQLITCSCRLITHCWLSMSLFLIAFCAAFICCRFFPVPCLFAPRAQKGIDKGKKSTRFWERWIVGWNYTLASKSTENARNSIRVCAHHQNQIKL